MDKMQSGRDAAESIKESAANAAASAKAGTAKAKASVREKAERRKRSDPAEKEAATREKEERDKQAQWNKEEAHFHNEEAERVAQSRGGGGGVHPGCKRWGSHSQARDDSNAAASAIGTEGYTPDTTGVGHATVTVDSRQPRGPVRSDAPRFT